MVGYLSDRDTFSGNFNHLSRRRWYSNISISGLKFDISMFYSGINSMAIWQYFRQFFKVFVLHVCRNSYVWAFDQNSDTAVQFGESTKLFLKRGIFYWLRYIFLCFWPLFSPAFVAEWLTHSAAMCSRAWRAQWPGFDSARERPSTKELFLMIPMHMMNREIIPGR